MVTEPVDPQVEIWSDNLEEELVEAGMEQAQAKAYRHAFELGMARVLSQFATKQELRQAILDLRDDLRREMADLRDDLRREMDIRFTAVNARFDELSGRLDRMERRFYWFVGITWAALIALLVRAFT